MRGLGAWLSLTVLVASCIQKPRSDAFDAAASAAPSGAAKPAPVSERAPHARTPLVDAGDKTDSAWSGGPLVVLAGGDVNLGRAAGQLILGDPKYNPLAALGALLETADLRFVNLESQLSDQRGETQSLRNHLIFTGPPAGADALSLAHIDVVSLANNHAWDYGKSALFETLANLRRAKVEYVGVSERPNGQYEPLIVSIKGKRISLFAVTQVWNQPPFSKHEAQYYVAWARFDLLKQRILRARKDSDVVLVSYHGGGEYLEVPMQWTRVFVREVMRLGVDAVIGHHPHVPHGVGWLGDRPVLYSLGNLVFAMHDEYPWTGTSFMARLTFGNGPVQVEACPYYIMGHTPRFFDGPSKLVRERAFKRHLEHISITVGGTRVGEPSAFSCMKLEPPLARGSSPGTAR
jgi:poly-gamma-glutamate capsule biosynthesis protein CapA/YwtB (metallophosphatase superfamily)